MAQTVCSGCQAAIVPVRSGDNYFCPLCQTQLTDVQRSATDTVHELAGKELKLNTKKLKKLAKKEFHPLEVGPEVHLGGVKKLALKKISLPPQLGGASKKDTPDRPDQ